MVLEFEKPILELEQKIAVPAWCSVDCKLGSVCVNLDFPQVFSCEVYAPDAGFPSGPDFDEQKLNVGLRICRTLFRQWRLKRRSLALGKEHGQPDRPHSSKAPKPNETDPSKANPPNSSSHLPCPVRASVAPRYRYACSLCHGLRSKKLLQRLSLSLSLASARLTLSSG